VLVVLVFMWAIIRIGNEAEARIQSDRRSADKIEAINKRHQDALAKESRARQEIICLVANDGVDRDKAFIDALIAASAASSPDRVQTPEEKRRREEGLRIFLERLEPSLRPIECTKFINDPVKYLRELRQRVDFATTTTTAPS
jgi:hypothetical protein